MTVSKIKKDVRQRITSFRAVIIRHFRYKSLFNHRVAKIQFFLIGEEKT